MPSEAAPKFRRRPDVGRCPFCGNHLNRWGTCQRRNCPAYHARYVHDQKQRIRVNLSAYHGGDGLVRIGTVTAPGHDVYPCTLRVAHKCPGEKCRLRTADIVDYNRAAAGHFTAMHRAALNRLRRAGHDTFHLLVRVWEVHRRGLLHVHPVVAHETEAESAASDFYFSCLATLSGTHGFGFTDRRRVLMSANSAARYLAKDLSETSLAAPNGLQIVHVSPRLTGITGCTGRALRRHRRERYLERQRHE